MGVVLSTHLARRSFEKVQLRDQTISVKGYAERPITADRASWSVQLIVRNPDMAAGYRKLEEDRSRLLGVLKLGGFAEEKVDSTPVEIETRFARDDKGNFTNRIEGFVVKQWYGIASSDVQSVAKLARSTSDLIRDGIELNADAPVYLFTQMDSMKLQMLSEASDNARERATRLMGSSGGRLGPLRSANQGVFQITPAFSTEVSGSGENDTTSIAKLIKATVTLEFGIE